MLSTGGTASPVLYVLSMDSRPPLAVSMAAAGATRNLVLDSGIKPKQIMLWADGGTKIIDLRDGMNMETK